MQARSRLLASGIGRHILDQAVNEASALLEANDAAVVDLGSGSGEALDALSRKRPIIGVGFDLSAAAADYAARRFPSLTWIVANADRRLPLLDASIDLAISLNGRRNPAECARVLKPGGHLLVSVPGGDDLIELRERVQQARIERDRTEAVIKAHEGAFSLVGRTTVREKHQLGREALVDLLKGTYRGERFSQGPNVRALSGLHITLSAQILSFALAGRPGAAGRRAGRSQC